MSKENVQIYLGVYVPMSRPMRALRPFHKHNHKFCCIKKSRPIDLHCVDIQNTVVNLKNTVVIHKNTIEKKKKSRIVSRS